MSQQDVGEAVGPGQAPSPPPAPQKSVIVLVKENEDAGGSTAQTRR